MITLENITAMMAKAIIPILKDFKQQINNTNDRLTRQYRMMTRAHKRYNRLFRQTHKTFQIHHLALLMFKDYITILVGTLQRIHRQYVKYKSALDNTLIRIEHLNSGYLMHGILDPKILAKYLEVIEDDLEETAPEFEPVFMSCSEEFQGINFFFVNINGGHSEGYIRNASLGSVPKIANFFLLLFLIHLENHLINKGSLLQSLTGWYVFNY